MPVHWMYNNNVAKDSIQKKGKAIEIQLSRQKLGVEFIKLNLCFNFCIFMLFMFGLFFIYVLYVLDTTRDAYEPCTPNILF